LDRSAFAKSSPQQRLHSILNGEKKKRRKRNRWGKMSVHGKLLCTVGLLKLATRMYLMMMMMMVRDSLCAIPE